MPPKEIKVPAEPPSGKGAELTPSPEPEAVNVEAEAGVRPIGDPGLLRTVSEFRAAIGVEAPPPTPEKSDAWRVGLEKLDLLQLQNLALELALSPASVLGQSTEALVGILLGHEASSRPKLKSAADVAAEQGEAILVELRKAQKESADREVRAAEREALRDAQLAGLQAQLAAQTSRLEIAEKALREGGEKKSESFEDDDDPAKDSRPFPPHYNDDTPRGDGSVVCNPHQKPPRPKAHPLRPHLLPDLGEVGIGKQLVDHTSKEAQAEYWLLKSVLSYFWDKRQYQRDFSSLLLKPSRTQAEVAEAALVLDAVTNSDDELYALLTTQLNLISLRTRAKSKNPTWKLTPEEQEEFDFYEEDQRSFAERHGIEGDVNVRLFSRINTFERRKRTARFASLAKAAGAAPRPPQQRGNGGRGGGGNGGRGGRGNSVPPPPPAKN